MLEQETGFQKVSELEWGLNLRRRGKKWQRLKMEAANDNRRLGIIVRTFLDLGR